MNEELLRYYREEVAYLRDEGRRYTQRHDDAARRLGVSPDLTGDPHVERLLEGCAFLAARVRLRQDNEYAELCARLLDAVAPGLQAPLPSAAVVQLSPDLKNPVLLNGCRIERGTRIQVTTRASDRSASRATFTTAHTVTLWPVALIDVSYEERVDGFPSALTGSSLEVAAAVRIRLSARNGNFSSLPIDSLQFYIPPGARGEGYALHRLLLSSALGTHVARPGSISATAWRGPVSLRQAGLLPNDAMFAPATRPALWLDESQGIRADVFDGHRLLLEAALLPERLLFITIGQLRERLSHCDGPDLDIVIPVSRSDRSLVNLVKAGALTLFATPVVNLFRRDAISATVRDGLKDWELNPPSDLPETLEVHSLVRVQAYRAGPQLAPLEMHPLWTRSAEATYTSRRSPVEALSGDATSIGRNHYVASKLVIDVVDRAGATWKGRITKLVADTLCTNGSVALRIPAGPVDADDWMIPAGGQVRELAFLTRPSAPLQRVGHGSAAWRLTAVVMQNRLPWDQDPAVAAAALRELLQLLGPSDIAAWTDWISGIVDFRSKPVMRRLERRGPVAYVACTQFVVTVDELKFGRTGSFIFGTALHEFLASYAAVNTLSELVLLSTTGEELHRWTARQGSAPIA